MVPLSSVHDADQRTIRTITVQEREGRGGGNRENTIAEREAIERGRTGLLLETRSMFPVKPEETHFFAHGTTRKTCLK